MEEGSEEADTDSILWQWHTKTGAIQRLRRNEVLFDWNGVYRNVNRFIHDAKTDAQRESLFEKVRDGDVRILLGSTQKLAWAPMSKIGSFASTILIVRGGPRIFSTHWRGKRLGNLNPVLDTPVCYARTFDSYLWQIKNKNYVSLRKWWPQGDYPYLWGYWRTVLTAAEFKAMQL